MSNAKKHPWKKYIGYEKLTSSTKEGLDAAIAYKLANGHVLVNRGVQCRSQDKDVHWASVKNTKHKRKVEKQ